MTNIPISQSQKRLKESIAKLFEPNSESLENCIFLTSSSDIGVIRNGGRNGARFAPKSLLNSLKKLSCTEPLEKYQFLLKEVANSQEEINDFASAQIKQTERITEALKQNTDSRIFHIGGGHDHIYPLLMSIGKPYSRIIVINIDAHADTRTDEFSHSGTPFRQFSQDFTGDFKLFQVGLNPFANSHSTLTKLSNGEMNFLWKKDFNEQKLQEFFYQISSTINDKTLVVLSLDADAISASEVPGVSAVNPTGLNLRELLQIWEHYKKLNIAHKPIIGIYELNPIYDSLSSISMKSMSSFIFETL